MTARPKSGLYDLSRDPDGQERHYAPPSRCAEGPARYPAGRLAPTKPV